MTAMNSEVFRHSQTPLKTLIKVWTLISLLPNSNAQGVLPSNLNPLRGNGVSSSLSLSETLYPWSSKTEGAAAVSIRDLSPNVLATLLPTSALPDKLNAGFQLDKKQLFLRSSIKNISGIGGYPLFALPIFSTDLVKLLSETKADVEKRVSQTLASAYQYSTNKWSFSVILANTTVPYALIQGAVTRFLKLSSTIKAPEDVVFTRVGVIYNGSTPIANIAILPYQIVSNSSFVPFSNFGQYKNFPASQPIEIIKVTPFDSSCAYQFVNQTAVLSPFQGHGLLEQQNFTTRSLEAEILVRVGQTAIDMSLYLWRREDGLPLEVKVWALKSVLYIASWQISAAALSGLFEFDPFSNLLKDGSFDENTELDTGFYVLGRLIARFIVRLIVTTAHILSLGVWKDIVTALLAPLQAMSADASAWAMEGEIYGPNVTNDSHAAKSEEKGKGNVVARWQIWIGDYEEKGV